jgi:hypothetical protein
MTRFIAQTDATRALEGWRRLQKTPERSGHLEATKWGRPTYQRHEACPPLRDALHQDSNSQIRR